jgi:hypothetical protein
MNWYKKAQDYEAYRSQVQRESAQNPYPFKDWFDKNGRTYIPFQTEDSSQIDTDVQSILEENNCQVTDYRGGYCAVGNRTYRIGKFLNSLRVQYIKRLQDQYQKEEIYNLEREVEKANSYFDNIINTFVNSSYRVDKQNEQFSIVISQNPHDVAQMSTDRDWVSCMELGEGDYYEDVFCEVRTGGIVAYLINANDLDIKNPLSRIHIRRFDNKDGQSYAVPEQTVYGNEIDGFQQAVSNWLNTMQQNFPAGVYSRKGGKYSDTFSDELLIAPTNQKEMVKWFRGEAEGAVYSNWEVVDELWSDFKSEKENGYYEEEYGGDMYDPGDPVSDEGKVFDSEEEARKYYNEMTTQDQQWGESEREEMDRIKGFEPNDQDGWTALSEEEEEGWKNDRFYVKERTYDHRHEMKRESASQILKSEKGAYPTDIINEIKDFAFSSRGSNLGLNKLFYSKYPELMTEEDVKTLNDKSSIEFISKLPEEEKKKYLPGWLDSINNTLDNIDVLADDNMRQDIKRMELSSDIKEKVDLGNHIAMMLTAKMNDYILYPLQELFSPIPEPIIQKLVQLKDNIYEKYNIERKPKTNEENKSTMQKIIDRDTYEDRIDADIVHTLNMTKSDTPTVQKYYESLIPKWKDEYTYNNYSTINVANLGLAIAKLGENGKQFIPFIEGKLEEAKNYKDNLINDTEEKSDRKNQEFIKMADKVVERFLYILDSLKSGTGHSTKYKFFKSKNWYKKAQIKNRSYDDEDMFVYLDSMIEEELRDENIDPYEKLHLKEKLLEELSSYPPGYKIKKTPKGWTVFSPDNEAVSVNEKKLIHSIPGGKQRFDFMYGEI